MKKVYFLLVLFAIANGVVAKNPVKDPKVVSKTENNLAVNKISGQVVDEKTGETLCGVKVTLYGTNIETLTDFDGKFEFTNLVHGAHAVIASYISYNQAVENIFVKKGEENVTVIKLKNK